MKLERSLAGRGIPESKLRAAIAAALADLNDIGVPGHAGFGVGVAPELPPGMNALPNNNVKTSTSYGNYVYSDGSVMCWIPAFYYRWNNASNPTYSTYGANSLDIQPYFAFADVAAANAAGYALHRAFYDGGAIKLGFFVDKYQCSNNSGIASSIALGNPLSTAAAHNPIAGLTGAPTNAYHGVIAAAKTRGADFFPASRFIHNALALLALAHAQAATSTANCAWYDATGVMNFPKGNNNNALRDINDTSVQFTSDGYASGNSAKTGSGVPFAKTTHNGQGCGVCDLNGNMWEISLGITVQDSKFWILKTAVAMKDLTSGTTLSTDAWGATGVAANYDDLGASYEALTGTGNNPAIGNAAQAFSAALTGLAWSAGGAGIPLSAGIGGTNLFGNDGLWNPLTASLCPIAGGDWGNGARAGVFALRCTNSRADSGGYVGFRAALYL